MKNQRAKFWLVEHGREAQLSPFPAAPPRRAVTVDLIQAATVENTAVVLVLGAHPGSAIGALGAAPLSVLALAPAHAQETGVASQVAVTLTPAGRLALASR